MSKSSEIAASREITNTAIHHVQESPQKLKLRACIRPHGYHREDVQQDFRRFSGACESSVERLVRIRKHVNMIAPKNTPPETSLFTALNDRKHG